MEVLIKELQKLVVSKAIENNVKDMEISNLKREIERLEKLQTPKN